MLSRRLEFGQEVDDFGLTPVDGADEFAAHDALAVDDVGLGILEGSVEIAALVGGIADGEEVDFVVGEETVIGVAVDVDADAHDGDTFGLEALLELDEGRHFLDAGCTPGGPEI